MTPKVLRSEAAMKRLLGIGFDAISEYDAAGQPLRFGGERVSLGGWISMCERSLSVALASDAANRVASQQLTDGVLTDGVLAVVGIDGGGKIVGFAEREVEPREAERLAHALDAAVSNELKRRMSTWLALAAGAALLILGGRKLP